MAFGLKFWERSDQNFNPNALWHEIDNAKHYQLSNTLPASSLFEFLESTETILTVKSVLYIISCFVTVLYTSVHFKSVNRSLYGFKSSLLINSSFSMEISTLNLNIGFS